SFECALDSAAFAACSSPVSYSGLGDGPHSFRVRARDPAGNLDPTPTERSWTIDSANLLANASFESDLSGWGGFQSTLDRVTASSNWQALPTVSYTTTSSGNRLQITAYSYNATTGDSFDIDKISLKRAAN